MSLREKVLSIRAADAGMDLYSMYGVKRNPYPSANQTSDNPHYRVGPAEELTEIQILSFLRDNRSQTIVIEGTQGVGKTNFLNFFEKDIEDATRYLEGYYVVRYLADPENSFDGTVQKLLEALGTEHIKNLLKGIKNIDNNEKGISPIERARSHDMRTALYRAANSEADVSSLLMDWLLGVRLLKTHKEELGVQFRLDTVESKTSAFRDLVEVSSEAEVLNGIFLLLDELEKQDGVLGPRAVVRYLSAIRAVIDALPRGLFLMVAVTPDALMRYSSALPALRGRLQNRIQLQMLENFEEAKKLADFYLKTARESAEKSGEGKAGNRDILSAVEVEECYEKLRDVARRRGDDGVRQREFLHELYMASESILAKVD